LGESEGEQESEPKWSRGTEASDIRSGPKEDGSRATCSLGQSESGKEGSVDVLTRPSLQDAILVLPLRSEVLLLIWESQPRHARQAHWGMDFNAAACTLSAQKEKAALGERAGLLFWTLSRSGRGATRLRF